MTARPFQGVEKVTFSDRAPELLPANIRRDPSIRLPAKGGQNNNVVSSDPASYVLQVTRTDFFDSRQSGSALKIEGTIVDATEGGNPVGSKAAIVLWQSNDFFLRDAVSVLAAATNLPCAAVSEASLEAACSTQQPMTGRLIRVNVGAFQPAKKSGNMFARQTFEPVEQNKAGQFVAPAINRMFEKV